MAEVVGATIKSDNDSSNDAQQLAKSQAVVGALNARRRISQIITNATTPQRRRGTTCMPGSMIRPIRALIYGVLENARPVLCSCLWALLIITNHGHSG